MYYGEIKKTDIANGEGVRASLFVSGCRNCCKGCFNQQTWDFCYGKEFTKETEDELIQALAPKYISGLTVLGGEPLAVIDILSVPAHIKHGNYVNTHLHISVGYLLVADENQSIFIKPDENSGVQWIELSDLFKYCTEPEMAGVYQKLLNRLSKFQMC